MIKPVASLKPLCARAKDLTVEKIIEFTNAKNMRFELWQFQNAPIGQEFEIVAYHGTHYGVLVTVMSARTRLDLETNRYAFFHFLEKVEAIPHEQLEAYREIRRE